MDTLAQILTYGNVHAFTNVAVVDTCSGLVVGAVLERLGGIVQMVTKLFEVLAHVRVRQSKACKE